MNKCVSVFSLFAVLLFFSSSVFASDARIEKIDQVLTELQTKEDFNGNILIYEKGEIIFEKSFGFKDYNKKISLDNRALFNVASVSKTVTATAVMQLVDRKN